MTLTWQPWTSVSQGATMPGAPVTALPWEDSNALFISDPHGGIYAIKAMPGYGWEAVPGLISKPGTTVRAVRWYRPPDADVPSYERFLLFAADADGEIFTTSGIPYQGWDAWTKVPGVLTTPGGLVTASSKLPDYGPFTLFAADSGGAIRETKTSAPPTMPQLAVTSVTAQTIAVSWSESNPVPVELDGFVLGISWMTGTTGGGRTFVPGPASRTFTFTPLDSGVHYKIYISAFSDNGYSPESKVDATTPAGTVTASLSALVENLPRSINYGLSIEGSSFAANEEVEVTVTWKVSDEDFGVFPLGPQTANPLGYFQVWFTGNTPEGVCPIEVPFGQPQPPQTFNVTAVGLTSNRTVSRSAGPFTCPFQDPASRA